ncbi:MAG: hypothetical protein UX86_C0021G0006 [Candidatus Amesbacteria bacterium GW2011_GWC1_47_15]|uniref:Uncharacterized protein n=1 Tax=Candidatus Amesbacteria bacterium GW2011_GWC1_47_15 TaxID=1618364 RepID=A0A0G1S280_9BACT|nr:MAG: hypothetical protein UX86_C0021G0006 [Candidatus Amesbacteria bacterium GW2011_GWC1_47_15]
MENLEKITEAVKILALTVPVTALYIGAIIAAGKHAEKSYILRKKYNSEKADKTEQIGR